MSSRQSSRTKLAPERAPRTTRSAGLLPRLRRIRLFLCDVDGILTDARVHMGDGIELKSFDVRDGFGLRLLQRHGIRVGWISHRPSQPTTQRAEELGIDFLHQAQGSKVAAAEKMIQEAGLSWKETCFMGDDLVDLAALRRAGLAVTVPHAWEEAQGCAHYTTRAAGGHGAVREVVELILKAQGRWQALVATYSE